jgi:hypothetical protein
MHSDTAFKQVMVLIDAGVTDREITRRTGIPRQTVNRWRNHPDRPRARPRVPPVRWRPPDPWAYCYLLGLYLGDGHIVTWAGRAASLRLTLDAGYPTVIAAAKNAITRTARDATVRHFRRPGCLVVHATHVVWPVAFPQHGPGRKHLRRIELVSWQRELTAKHPKALVRGLIHSDGCRTMNRFSVRLPSGRVGEYAYPRYFFSNLSEDVRRIFSSHCELIGVRWTQSNARNVSIADRRSVAILDSFVWPKA